MPEKRTIRTPSTVLKEKNAQIEFADQSRSTNELRGNIYEVYFHSQDALKDVVDAEWLLVSFLLPLPGRQPAKDPGAKEERPPAERRPGRTKQPPKRHRIAAASKSRGGSLTPSPPGSGTLSSLIAGRTR